MIIVEKDPNNYPPSQPTLQVVTSTDSDTQLSQILSNEDIPAEAPPAYNDLVDDSVVLKSRKEKELPPIIENGAASSQKGLADPRRTSSQNAVAGPSKPWLKSNPIIPPSPGALSSSAKASQTDVRSTVVGLLRDLVRQPPHPVFSSGILDSCASACNTHGLSFSDLLQEPCVEGHTPLYWAVIKWTRLQPTPKSSCDDEDDLLGRLIAYTAPLQPSTMADVRLACVGLTTKSQSDEHENTSNSIFQRLRSNPLFCPPMGADDILLGRRGKTDDSEVMECFHRSNSNSQGDSNSFIDEARVFEPPRMPGSFLVRLQVPLFQQRMRVSNGVAVEFIARGRPWILQFFVIPRVGTTSSPPRPQTLSHLRALQRLHRNAQQQFSWFRDSSREGYAEGTWAVSLGLLEGSSPIIGGLTCRLVIPPGQKNAKNDPGVVSLIDEDIPPEEPSVVDTPLNILLPEWITSSLPGSYTVVPNVSTQISHPRDSAILVMKTYPFTSSASDVERGKTTPGQLVAPPLPPFPSDGDEKELSRREKRKRRKHSEQVNLPVVSRDQEALNCACDVMTSFEEKGGTPFDGAMHIGSDGTLHAILEGRILKQGERAETGCIIG